MNKQEIMNILGFEPFAVFAARQRIQVLSMLLQSYDKGEYTLEQFKSLVVADRRTGKTTNDLLDAVEYITEHPNITTLVVEYPKDYKILGEEACRDVKEYLNILHTAGKIPKQEVVLQTKPISKYAARGFAINSWQDKGYVHNNTLTIKLKV